MSERDLKISEEFFPGSLGEILALQGHYYAKNRRFGTYFEAKVDGELSGFADRKASNDLVLVAHDKLGVAASLILDLNDPDSAIRALIFDGSFVQIDVAAQGWAGPSSSAL